jgi:hypothetical protein
MYLIVGYVVCYVMPSFCTKNCIKLCGKAFYMIYFVFMQNLNK